MNMRVAKMSEAKTRKVHNASFEPPREFRRLIAVSHAAMADSVSR